jgi:hypothetical protein
VALVIAGRYVSTGGTVPIFNWVQSPSFASKYGSVRALVGDKLQATDGSDIGDLVASAMRSFGVARGRIALADSGPKTLVAGVFFNQYKVIVMLTEPSRLPTGRRIVVATSMPTMQPSRYAVERSNNP